MRLKHITISGFKTFADRTELDLTGDLTAIVGPNGCGKSNIVDAILWCLGEPNSKSLRAQSSQEIIFNGSARRKSLSRAEVSLFFDNEEGVLPIDSSQVQVVRRIDRSGESEYKINTRHCRLKDVLELFADSGIGRAGYSIVGQKEIDAALTASAEDRRAWIDEAAGVQRYRAKRNESLRRLAVSTENVVRLEDLLREIVSQREPLWIEAEEAKRYRAIAEALRETEIGSLTHEVARDTKQLSQIEARRIEIQRATEQCERERAQADQEAANLQALVLQAEAELALRRDETARAAVARERALAEERMLAQRLTDLKRLEDSLTVESSAGDTRLEQLRLDRENALAALDDAQARTEEARIGLVGPGQEASRLKEQLAQAEASLLEARQAAASYVREQAEHSLRLSRLRALERETQGARSSVAELQSAISEAQKELDGRQETLRAMDKLVFEATATRSQAQKNLHESAARHRALLAQHAVLEGSARGLAATIELNEGMPHGARAVLDLVRQGRLKARYKTVSSSIEVSTDLATAIESALGSASSDLIVETEEDAKQAIEILKRERLGRATFQPISLMKLVPKSAELDSASRKSGIVGVASELVKADSRERPVIDSLLGRILVAKSLEDAVKHARTGGWKRIVTLEGEVLQASGALTGGLGSGARTGELRRRAELKEAQAALEEIHTELAESDALQKTAERVIETTGAELSRLEADREPVRAEVSELEGWRHKLRAELHQMERSALKSEEERAKLASTPVFERSEPDVATLQRAYEEIMFALASRTADSERARETLAEREREKEEASKRAHEAVRRHESATAGEQHRRDRLERLEVDRTKLIAMCQKSAAEAAEATERAARAEQELSDLDRQRAELQTAVLRQNELARSLEDTREARRLESHQTELARTRLEAKRANALQRLMEEYGMGFEDALENAEQSQPPKDATTAVNSLRRELKAMGAVNLGAIEAYERLTQRYEELHSQLDDIQLSAEQIKQGLFELDGLMRIRFEKTFSMVRGALVQTFSKLFEGGKADLTLTDAHDSLRSGVELEITLPGKQRQRLELLSGGERALGACAFLFALLKVRPSPLVVLDEVDAPLDGRNVERFIAMLGEFAGTIQFLLITHNPVTIAAAEVWFGVTMQEPGVTSVMPCRAPGVRAAAEIGPAAAAAT